MGKGVSWQNQGRLYPRFDHPPKSWGEALCRKSLHRCEASPQFGTQVIEVARSRRESIKTPAQNVSTVTTTKINGKQHRTHTMVWFHYIFVLLKNRPDFAYSVFMQLVMLSDTHQKFPEQVPNGDVLIHSGDLTHLGSFDEFCRGIGWLQRLSHRYKILVPGNHDQWAENLWANGRENDLILKLKAKGIVYLHNSGVTIDGVSFYGSPWIPTFAGAFNADRGQLRETWKKIPSNVDVLVTHCPPHGILDTGTDKGCFELAAAVRRIQPRLHCFGHVHVPGKHQIRWPDKTENVTDFYNAATTSFQHTI